MKSKLIHQNSFISIETYLHVITTSSLPYNSFVSLNLLENDPNFKFGALISNTRRYRIPDRSIQTHRVLLEDAQLLAVHRKEGSRAILQKDDIQKLFEGPVPNHYKQSPNSFLGEFPNEVYVIITGKVNIFKPRQIEDIVEESKLLYMCLAKIQTSYLRNKVQVSLEDLYEVLEFTSKESKILKNWKSSTLFFPSLYFNLLVNSGQLIYSDKYLAEVLNGLSKHELEDRSHIFNHLGILKFHSVMQLKSGSVVGEKGIEKSAPRSATVITVENCDLAVIEKGDYIHIMGEIRRAENQSQIEFMHEKVFSGSLPRELCDRLASEFFLTVQTYSIGDIIFEQDSNTNVVYILVEGQVMLFREIKNKISTKNHQLIKFIGKKTSILQVTTIHPGEFLGDTCFLNKQQSLFFGASCITECKLIKMRVQIFRSFLKNYSKLSNPFKISINKKMKHRQYAFKVLMQKHYKDQQRKFQLNLNAKSISQQRGGKSSESSLKILGIDSPNIKKNMSLEELQKSRKQNTLIKKLSSRKPKIIKYNSKDLKIEIKPHKSLPKINMFEKLKRSHRNQNSIAQKLKRRKALYSNHIESNSQAQKTNKSVKIDSMISWQRRKNRYFGTPQKFHMYRVESGFRR